MEIKNKKTTSVVISIKDRDRIKLFIEIFKKNIGFKISIAEFVKQVIDKKLKEENL